MVWLVVHMWLWLALAAILGLIIGCWICGQNASANDNGDLDIEVARLRSRLEECNAEKTKLRAQVAEMEALAKLDAPAPTFYDSPTEGTPDDLKKIKGIGPKLEGMLNGIGVFYYRQIAGWSNEQVGEVDDRLTAFKGRITRDDWRGQAKVLAEGGATDFSNRYDRGEAGQA